MNQRILITAIGSSSASVLISELKKQGYYVVGCDINEKEYLYEALIVDAFVKVPYFNNVKYIDVLEELVVKYDIDHLLPLTDPEVDIINKNRDRFQDINLWMVSGNVVDLARDKKRLASFMCNRFPEHYIKTANNIEDAKLLDFPIIAKPKNGRSSQGIEIMDTMEILEQKQHLFDGDYLFQEFIKGSVCTVDILRDRFGNMICIPREEVLRNLSGLGLSVKMMDDTKLLDLCAEIVSTIDLVGCINIEFIKTEDNYFMIEINPRCSGGIGFSEKSGYEFVKNLSNCYNKKAIDYTWRLSKMTIVKSYSEYITK